MIAQNINRLQCFVIANRRKIRYAVVSNKKAERISENTRFFCGIPLLQKGFKGVLLMIKEKTFYKSFMVLALSLALQNLLTYGVNLMDTMMLGRYSQDAMGGVSLCNQVQFLLQMLVVGAGEPCEEEAAH